MPVTHYRSHAREDRHPAPIWLLLGGIGLAGLAGYVNVVGLLAGISHVPVSHMSGAVAHISMDSVAGAATGTALGVLASFLAGSVVCGVLIGSERLMPGRRYGAALLIEALALVVAAWAMQRGARSATCWSAFACGVQNAMATSYCGLVIRTTHVTGIVTDLGLLIGHWLRHRRSDGWRFALLGGLLGAFLAGGALGSVATVHLGKAALWPAAVICGAAGAAYLAWRCSNRAKVGGIW